MSNINYRNTAIRELKNFSEEFPEYKLGEILYSVIRQAVSEPVAIKSLRELSDEQIYTMIDNAKEFERDSKETELK